MYADGNGLYLQVRENSRAWVIRFTFKGKARMMGLGSLRLVSLAEARERALAVQKLALEGIDPIKQRRAERQRTDTPVFRVAAERFISAHRQSWRNVKHASQWGNTLAAYANPVVGNLSIDEITTEHVLKILRPIWHSKPETASRVRGRIERILDWGASRGYRSGANPARWSGHLEYSLPSRRSVKKEAHHPALPWLELPTFYAELADQAGQASKALLFTILTAARTNETRGARWEEFDLTVDVPTWCVPSERMKAQRAHRVPLAPPVTKFLDQLPRFDSGYLFEGRAGKPLSVNAMLAVLKRMNRTDITVHGFRSTFRDWCAEQMAFPREIAEAALAHVNRDRVEAAYLRSDLFTMRYRLMQAWTSYVTEPQEATILAHPAARVGP